MSYVRNQCYCLGNKAAVFVQSHVFVFFNLCISRQILTRNNFWYIPQCMTLVKRKCLFIFITFFCMLKIVSDSVCNQKRSTIWNWDLFVLLTFFFYFLVSRSWLGTARGCSAPFATTVSVMYTSEPIHTDSGNSNEQQYQ
jgi:hypothetical protein